MRGLVQRVRSAKVTVGGSSGSHHPAESVSAGTCAGSAESGSAESGSAGIAGTSQEAGVTSEVSAAEVVGEIGPGILLLVGVTHGDTAADADKLADKVWNLRIFDDADGVMNISVAEGSQAVLVVSQFTLYGDTRRGRRPAYSAAAPPAQAEPLVQAVVEALAARGARVQTGRFGADMAVHLVNDGPVTLLIEV